MQIAFDTQAKLFETEETSHCKQKSLVCICFDIVWPFPASPFCTFKVPIVALTATATPVVRRDICQSLKLKNAAFVCTGFDR